MANLKHTSDLPGLASVKIDRGGTILLFPPSAVVLLQTAQGKIVFVRQFRPSKGAATLELPGGRIESGERPIDAARRELLEETGLACGRLRLILTLDLDFSVSKHQTLVFHGGGSRQSRPNASFEVVHIPLRGAVAMVNRGQLTHAPSVAGVLWLAAQGRKS